MSDLFGFVNDLYNYEDRKVARYEKGDLLVSTCHVSDGRQPFETAIQLPLYNNGSLIPVAAYDTIQEARAGHKLWVKTITAQSLPDCITECFNSVVGTILHQLGEEGKHWRKGVCQKTKT